MANRKIGSLLVSVGADTKQLKEGLRDAEQQASKFGRTSSRVASRSRSSFAGMAAFAGAAALSTVGAIAGAGIAGATIVGRALDGMPSAFREIKQFQRENELSQLGAKIDADPAAANAAYWMNPANAFSEVYHEFQMTVGRMILDESSAIRKIADSIESLVEELKVFIRYPESIPGVVGTTVSGAATGFGNSFIQKFGGVGEGENPGLQEIINATQNPRGGFWN